MLDIEPICEAVHKAYCDERLRQSKKAYWTGGDYSKLDEATKNYDRATVQAVLKYIGHKQLQAKVERLEREHFCPSPQLSKSATTCDCAHSDRHRALDWACIDRLQAEIKRLNELVFAYESVEAPVNPLLADNERLERELTCANEECGGLQENVERLKERYIEAVNDIAVLKKEKPNE